jgi:segregation and condensation protein B
MTENQNDDFPTDAAEAETANSAEEHRAEFQADDRAQQLRLLEAILFAAAEPLTREAIALRMPKSADLDSLVDELEQIYTGRGVNLVRVAGKLMLRTAPDLVDALKIERTVSRKLSRAAIETLAIIAYHQPITRAEIEEVRGVALSRGTLDLLMEAGWIQPKGHRETPGRPATWVTTEHFLLHFGIDHLNDLPGVEDLRAAGLLDARPAVSAYSEEAGISLPDAPGEDAETEEPETVDTETGETPAEKPQGG